MNDSRLDELFERSQRGEATAEEERELRAHAAECPASAIEQALWRASELDESDDEAVRRVVDGAFAALVADAPSSEEPIDRIVASAYAELTAKETAVEEAPTEDAAERTGESRPGSSPWRRVAQAAVVLLVFGVGAGASALLLRWIDPGEQEPVPHPPPATREVAPEAVEREEDPVVEIAPVEMPTEVEPRAQPSADELLQVATEARREGNPRRAIRTLRRLQRRYPRSSEAIVSQVSLGNLLLGSGDSRSAHAAFARYLSRRPNGSLAPEALAGKARAEERLGRDDTARQTWRVLLDRFPSSIHAARARHRLGE